MILGSSFAILLSFMMTPLCMCLLWSGIHAFWGEEWTTRVGSDVMPSEDFQACSSFLMGDDPPIARVSACLVGLPICPPVLCNTLDQ
jgi:hypothetical protein